MERNLRGFWIIIHGANAPEGEKANARKIRNCLIKKIKVVRVLPDDAIRLSLLAKATNVITVGGPTANRWTFILNDYVVPKWTFDIDETKEWPENITNMKIVNEFGVSYDIYRKGIIGVGEQHALRLRALKVINVAGGTYCGTCTMGKAFCEDAEPGVYQTGCIGDLSFDEPCPFEELSYTKIG